MSQMNQTPSAPGALPLSGLDTAFARYLHSVVLSSDPRHSLLAALTSHQFGRGHAWIWSCSKRMVRGRWAGMRARLPCCPATYIRLRLVCLGFNTAILGTLQTPIAPWCSTGNACTCAETGPQSKASERP